MKKLPLDNGAGIAIIVTGALFTLGTLIAGALIVFNLFKPSAPNAFAHALEMLGLFFIELFLLLNGLPFIAAGVWIRSSLSKGFISLAACSFLHLFFVFGFNALTTKSNSPSLFTLFKYLGLIEGIVATCLVYAVLRLFTGPKNTQEIPAPDNR